VPACNLATVSESPKQDWVPLRAVPEISVEEVELHGHRVSYRRGGEGPLLVLIHGITGSSQTWREVMPLLAQDFTIVAPDLLGHGESAKPRGDYSMGAYASGIRDLVGLLGYDKGTVVGHSLGGGVALQFAYQFPERVERMVLVSSGGLGRDVNPILRAPWLPGAELVLPLLASMPLLDAGRAVGRFAGRLGFTAGPDLAEMATGFASLGDAEARRAFIQTVRAVIDLTGQRVSASDRLYLAAALPTLIVWGEQDKMIPVQHGHDAHAAIPGSRLEVFEGAGHFPHLSDPLRFVKTLREFVGQTDPADLSDDLLRELGRQGPPKRAATA
jgi:pimeloyl-ACP methyl ester carboxylesterase